MLDNHSKSAYEKLHKLIAGKYFDKTVDVSPKNIENALYTVLSDLRKNTLLDVVKHLESKANDWDRSREDFGSILRTEADVFRNDALHIREEHDVWDDEDDVKSLDEDDDIPLCDSCATELKPKKLVPKKK